MERMLLLRKVLWSVILFVGSIVISYAQTYRDSVLMLRQDKMAGFLKEPSTPLNEADTPYLHYYEPDSTYRIRASVELLHDEQPFRMPTSDGTSKAYVRYGKARFQLHGEPVELTLYRSADLFVSPIYRNHLFLPFTDMTNGSDTYGGGRYLDLSVADIRDGHILIDFNDAYNPYCAYSSGYRCPVPPKANNLSIAIPAGEKKYTGPMKQRPRPNVPPKPLTEAERNLIRSGDTTQLLRVIQDTVPDETRILKSLSEDIDPKDALLPLLAQRMYLAVTDSTHPGVGIAAPQVGINRNLIWVQRFDKAGEPLELYVNPKITWRSKLLRKGVEGCLSIPDTMGQVLRNYTIRLTYQDTDGEEHEEMVEGFTAVIFQHETDHLYGILFTDRLAEQAAGTYQLINGEVDLYLEKRLRRQ
ncbi:peptide deformylase [Parapedobacter koreensis]|nr:peptide deformylase [Parapedobacter koreensis]